MKKIADIKVGYTCNNDCIHCVISENRANLIKIKKPVDRTFEECRKEILDAYKNGANEIVLTGGEPTIRSDFLDLLAIINELSLTLNVQTNGRMFENAEFAGNVALYPNIYFSIALHGPTPEIHDLITRRKNSFNQTINGIKFLVSVGKPVSIKLVISKMNYKHIHKTIDLMIDLGLNHINITFPHGMGNAGINFFDVVPKYVEIEPYLYETFNYCTDRYIYFETETFPYCFLKGFEEKASEHFNLGSMETRPVGVKTTDWLKARMEIKKKAAQCSDCLYNEICEGPWSEYIEFYGSDEFKPIEINPQSMFSILMKLKTIKNFRSGYSEDSPIVL